MNRIEKAERPAYRKGRALWAPAPSFFVSFVLFVSFVTVDF